MTSNSNIDKILGQLLGKTSVEFMNHPDGKKIVMPAEELSNYLNEAKQAIQQELLKARIDQIVKIRQLFDETVDISDFLIALHEQYKSLQAKLKGDE